MAALELRPLALGAAGLLGKDLLAAGGLQGLQLQAWVLVLGTRGHSRPA